MIFQSPLEHHIENVLMFCHKAGLQAKQISDASTLWVNYARALENLQGRKIDGQYQAVNLIVGPHEASAFCRMLSSDALSLLDDRNQDQVISQTCDPHAREKADLLLAAMECLGALSRQHKHLFDLLITDIFLMPSQEARGGSTSSAIGVIWANPKTSYRVPDIVEFLVHELTHHALFIDEHRYGHYDYSVILDQETWAQSALLKTPRPLDKVIHSIIVATEIILFREQCLGHPAAPLVHPPTAKICAQVSQSVESVENQIAALLRQGVTPVSPRVRDLLNQVRDIVTSDRIKKFLRRKPRSMKRSTFQPRARVFANLPAVATILLVIVHQSLVASSAYFLTQTISRYQQDQPYATPLVLYFLSMILPFVPGCVSFITTQHWINAVHRKFCLSMAQAVYGKLEAYRSPDRKAAFDSAISRNAFSTISSYISLAHDFLSLALNSLLSIIVIGVILPAEIALGYVISLVLSGGLVACLSRLVKPLSIDVEQRYSNYGGTLHKAWDNMVLGNSYNSRLWRKEFDANSNAYYAATQRLSVYKQLGNIAIAFASLIPTAYLVYELLVRQGPEAGIIAAIIVNLTRIFHILNSLSALVYEWVEWTSATARLRYLFGFLSPISHDGLPRAPIGTMTINDEPVTDYQTVCDALSERRCGRLTIRGDNGAGKSTLLLAIKQAFPEQTYLLPAAYTQLCWEATHSNLSTGQRARALIEELLTQDAGIQYLLLDEWDANLDQENRRLIDQMLKVISKERVVVEVRH